MFFFKKKWLFPKENLDFPSNSVKVENLLLKAYQRKSFLKKCLFRLNDVFLGKKAKKFDWESSYDI